MRAIHWVLPALGLFLSQAASAQNLIKNGDFDTIYDHNTSTVAASVDSYRIATYDGQFGNKDVADWTAYIAYNFVYTPGAGGNNASTTAKNYGYWLYKKNLPDTSPAGGNYLASYGPGGGTMSQSVTGLTIGQTYTLSFWWGATQLNTAVIGTTPISSGWDVTMSGTGGTDVTGHVQATLTSMGTFTGWVQESITFVASSADETLTFKTVSTGSPPMSLLDGVSLVAVVPEPSSVAMMLAGFGVLVVVSRRRAPRN